MLHNSYQGMHLNGNSTLQLVAVTKKNCKWLVRIKFWFSYYTTDYFCQHLSSYSSMEPLTMAVLSELCVVVEHLNMWIVSLYYNVWMCVCVYYMYCVILCEETLQWAVLLYCTQNPTKVWRIVNFIINSASEYIKGQTYLKWWQLNYTEKYVNVLL